MRERQTGAPVFDPLLTRGWQGEALTGVGRTKPTARRSLSQPGADGSLYAREPAPHPPPLRHLPPGEGKAFLLNGFCPPGEGFLFECFCNGPASQYQIALVQHHGLAGGDGPEGTFEFHPGNPFFLRIHPGGGLRLAVADLGGAALG